MLRRFVAASMGPRHHCRGIGLYKFIVKDSAGLQWGHGITAVEFASDAYLSMWKCHASMGPRHHCRGIFSAFIQEDQIPEILLQWGHGITAVELERHRGAERGTPLASMGPRHHCRGIAVFGLGNPPKFNLLQWGHGITAVEFSAWAWKLAMPIPLQWGHGITAVEFADWPGACGAGTSFNGATASLPWNLAGSFSDSIGSMELQWGHGITAVEFRKGATGRHDGRVPASMGPRHHCRGICRRPSAHIQLTRASMGPRHHCRGIKTVNVYQDSEDAASMGPRHHCRGIMGRPGETASAPTAASMGPRHHCRGIVARTIPPQQNSLSLQWGHGITAVELTYPTARHSTA